MRLNNIRMSAKLPVAFVTLSLAVTLFISWTGYREFKTSLVDVAHTQLEMLTTERAKAIETWFSGLEGQVANYANDPTVVAAVNGFTTTFGLLMEDPVADLQKAYIDENPHPTGEKDLLDRAEATIPYNFQHEQFHPVFRSIKNRLELYDFFLFSADGDLFYSVYKERDFATNFMTGPFSDSGLGQAFRAAVEGSPGETHFVDFAPYAPSNNDPAAFMSAPIISAQGQLIGVLAIQLPADQLQALVASPEGLGRTGELTIVGQDLRARTSSRFEGRHTLLNPVSPNTDVMTVFDNGAVGYTHLPDLGGYAAVGDARLMSILGNPWFIVGEIQLDEVFEAARSQRNKTLVFTVVAMLIVGLCGWFVSRTFSGPLNMVVAAMNRISQRDYAVDLPDLNRQDEIGDLARALTLVADRLRDFDDKLAIEQEQAEAQKFAVNELGTGLKRLAEGDFSAELTQPFSAEYDALRVNYNDTIARLGETIKNLKSFSEMLGSQTSKIGRDSTELSNRTESQAATLEETAAAIDQITETITQSGTELRSAEKLVLETNDQVKQGRGVVESTTKAMDEIEKSSQEISSIIRVVDDIAFQTNLLALNAGVEAARAGDAGRGFAVVAAEVRQLAMRSAEAVSQIKSLIETSAANVNSGVTLVRDTEAVLQEIVQRMDGISTLITSVATGAVEQSGNIAEINTGVNNLDRVTQQNASMVENSNESVQALTTEAGNLVSLLAKFRVGETGTAANTGSTARSSANRVANAVARPG